MTISPKSCGVSNLVNMMLLPNRMICPPPKLTIVQNAPRRRVRTDTFICRCPYRREHRLMVDRCAIHFSRVLRFRAERGPTMVRPEGDVSVDELGYGPDLKMPEFVSLSVV